MKKSIKRAVCAAAVLAALAPAAQAADWSDTEIMLNTGSRFREPFNPFAAKDPAKP